METFVFKYEFNGKKYMSEIKADSLYAAHLAFDKFLKDRIKIDSVEPKEKVKGDPFINHFKSMLGI